MKFIVYLMDMLHDPDAGWIENARTQLGSLVVEKEPDEMTDKDILQALAQFTTVDLMGRQCGTISTTDRRRVYAEDLYQDGSWWEVGAVKGHQPMYGLEQVNREEVSCFAAKWKMDYSAIRKEIENLYEAGTICMEQSGTDTQYAPIRYALEFVIGEQPQLVRSMGGMATPAASDGIRFSEEELSDMVARYRSQESPEMKMAVSALEWVLGRKTRAQLYGQ